MTIFTRTQYMSGECTHHEYYIQFATPALRQEVARHIGVERIKASTDPCMNDIPLADWDRLPVVYYYNGQRLKQAGDYLTKAGAVCIAKAIAREIKNEIA